MKQHLMIYFLFASLLAVSCTRTKEVEKIPVIYSTDLYQPPQDPDDHYDLALLASLPELDVRAIVFDNATEWRDAAQEAGTGALRQMSDITRQPLPPYAIGLRNKLISQQDKAENQPAESQKGVDLILQTLRESQEKIVLFLVGSCRDFAVAFNREPDLLREKVKAVYVSAGNGPDGWQFEWNVMLDPQAYACLMNSGLPIYWAPCFSQVNLRQATKDEVTNGDQASFNSYYIVPNEAELLETASGKLKNYFAYALNKRPGDPVDFLSQPIDTISPKARNMWSTASFFHAAGRKIYLHNGKYRVYSPEKAQALGVAEQEIPVYEFRPVTIETTEIVADSIVFRGVLDIPQSNIKVFRYIHSEYNSVMVSALSGLLEGL
ncbi:MAG: nucleoside hydrolase [Dysgonamonadaceae bacterium]|jgi:hypothetical protein|nr:nucleoside hydrolase [Dysgonamonadaceae bacterium]